MTTLTTLAKTQLTKLSPAERTAKLLAFKGYTHNFTASKTPSKVISRGVGAMRTA